MKQRLKRFLALSLCAAMAAGTMSGYASAEGKLLEGEELTIWLPHFWSGQLADSSDNEAWQKIAENLGVKLNFIQPPLGQEQEQLNVMLASGEYPDIIITDWSGDAMFTGGIDKLIDDGVVLALDDLLEEYAPDYMAAIDNFVPEEEKNLLYTDNGHTAGIYAISPYPDTSYEGVIINRDWLEELGMDIPTTLQEYEDMLIAFKEKKGATAPMLLKTNEKESGTFVSAFNIGPDFYQVDGEVKYGPMQPEYKEYLTLMNKWYEMGLIDKDFATHDEDAWIRMMIDGESGMITSDSPDSWSSYLTGRYDIAVGNYPVQNEGDKVEYRLYAGSLQVKTSTFTSYITTACEKPEVALQFLNYGYTEEGFLLYNYGVEGETYTRSDKTIVCNGIEMPLVEYTDKMLNNPDYPIMDAVLQFKVHVGPFLRFENEGNPTIVVAGDEALERRQKLTDDAGTSLCIPPTTMTVDEGEAYAKIISQIETYRETAFLEFIMGIRSLDEFGTYVEELKKLGIEEAVSYKQAALDRYNNRR